MLTLDKLTSLCKRRGFIYPSSEIYDGFGAIYDYGPLGIELKNNIAKAWWKSMVQLRRDIVGLDSAIFMHPQVWVASGHTGAGFDEALIECRGCHNRIRADFLLMDKFGIDADKAPIDEINKILKDLRSQGKKVTCENCGSSDLAEAKRFNLLVKSNLGSPTDALSEENVVYLRAETCQGIYLNYKNIVDTMRVKIPFGVAQIGKSFRNEIVARQFIFRTREFEQMEMQYFVKPGDDDKYFEELKKLRYNWYLEYGISKENLKWHEHEKLAHYASAAYDIEYNFTAIGGFKELEGIHARGDWDLSQHTKHSGVKLDYFDEATNERFTPHVVETAAGLNRNVLAFMSDAYCEEEVDGEQRVVLKFDPRIAPMKVAILPLQKKPEALIEKSDEIWQNLAKNWMCDFDVAGSIGKRYRRQDEIGTPFCVTIDFDTIGQGDKKLKDTVTIRERDSMKQERIKIKDLVEYLEERLGD
ncbi:MAG: glycine--tRNA ligase [Patescibacteria group bacterium]|nr:glycine--tRNA ligase [Patescibacteria group bacterium]